MLGCCESKNKHATEHYRTTLYPIVRSLEPGEGWGYLYEERTLL